MTNFNGKGTPTLVLHVRVFVDSQTAGAVVAHLADLELSNSPESEDRNSGQQRRIGKKQLEQSIEKILVKKLLESGVIRDVHVAAYQMEGSCRKAADYLTDQGIKTSKSSVARAVKRAGGVSAVMSAKKTMRRDFIE